jgi:PAS domain S-box-containing protein
LLPSSHIAIQQGYAVEIIKHRSQLFIVLEQAEVHLREAQKTLRKLLQRGHNTLALGRSLADKPRRLQKTPRARENELQKLLATSPDAIVVTKANGCLIAANPRALNLFGVSETNMKKFTIDAFLSHGQLPESDRNGSAFVRRRARHGKCEVRRLDGSLRIAEYSFVANFFPFRHLYKFCSIAAINDCRPATLKAQKGQAACSFK